MISEPISETNSVETSRDFGTGLTVACVQRKFAELAHVI